jgi:hypothetical protein
MASETLASLGAASTLPASAPPEEPPELLPDDVLPPELAPELLPDDVLPPELAPELPPLEEAWAAPWSSELEQATRPMAATRQQVRSARRATSLWRIVM